MEWPKKINFRNKISMLEKFVNGPTSRTFLQRCKRFGKFNTDSQENEDLSAAVATCMNLDDYDLITNDEVQQIQIVEYLLDIESKRWNPPKSGFNRRRGTFDIPFQTKIYTEWVSHLIFTNTYAGYKILSNVECLFQWNNGEMVKIRHINNIVDGKHANRFHRMFLEESRLYHDEIKNMQIKHNLLLRESQHKEPPKFAYNDDRGFFDIPFQTEAYRQWVRNA